MTDAIEYSELVDPRAKGITSLYPGIDLSGTVLEYRCAWEYDYSTSLEKTNNDKLKRGEIQLYHGTSSHELQTLTPHEAGILDGKFVITKRRRYSCVFATDNIAYAAAYMIPKDLGIYSASCGEKSYWREEDPRFDVESINNYLFSEEDKHLFAGDIKYLGKIAYLLNTQKPGVDYEKKADHEYFTEEELKDFEESFLREVNLSGIEQEAGKAPIQRVHIPTERKIAIGGLKFRAGVDRELDISAIVAGDFGGCIYSVKPEDIGRFTFRNCLPNLSEAISIDAVGVDVVRNYESVIYSLYKDFDYEITVIDPSNREKDKITLENEHVQAILSGVRAKKSDCVHSMRY